MPQPTPYARGFNFTDYQSSHPDDPVPGYRLDAELDGVSTTLQGVLGNLALIQRDDGKLIDGAVTIDSIDHDLFLAIAAAAPQGPQGIQGIQGPAGPSPNFTFASHSRAAGAAPTLDVTGAYPDLHMDFGVPRGDAALPGEATLPDADYGDLTISAGGSHMRVDSVLDGQVPAVHTDITGLQAQIDAMNAAIAAKLAQAGGNVTSWLTVAGLLTGNAKAVINGTGAGSALVVDDHTNASGANIQLTGNGATTPNKTIRAIGGAFQITNSAYDAVIFQLDDVGNAQFYGSAIGVTPAGGDNSTKFPTTAWVRALLGGYQVAGSYATTAALAAKADAFTAINAFNVDASIVDGNNGQYLTFTGGTPRTLTFGTPTAGHACIVVNRSTANMTIACAGGYYKNGSAVATTNLTLAPNGKLTAFHEGGGVWTFDGTGF